jgi:hypothetical protein
VTAVGAARPRPERTVGLPPVRLKAEPGKKVQRKFDETDLITALSNAVALKQPDISRKPLAPPVKSAPAEIDVSVLYAFEEVEESPPCEVLTLEQKRERIEMANAMWDTLVANLGEKRSSRKIQTKIDNRAAAAIKL